MGVLDVLFIEPRFLPKIKLTSNPPICHHRARAGANGGRRTA
jgi:hypothetical protein